MQLQTFNRPIPEANVACLVLEVNELEFDLIWGCLNHLKHNLDHLKQNEPADPLLFDEPEYAQCFERIHACFAEHEAQGPGFWIEPEDELTKPTEENNAPAPEEA